MSESQTTFSPPVGTIVTCRKRQWVVLPSDISELIRLRPLSGNEEQVCGIFTQLGEPIEAANFPLPQPHNIQNHEAAKLLLDATRLSLRSGAGPFRCLGRLLVRPRPYQLVPLLMALKQDIIRLLISDGVGIGKTIEAGLIIRELLDRNEIKRVGVLCPPQICDQWQRELKEKFHIDAVVIRSGTVSKLERNLPSGNHHIFSYYTHIIVSLDYAKSDRRRASFLTHCPDLVVVDEVHTATSSKEGKTQQRHQLVSQIAANPQQKLILLTATPHSGIEANFLSILSLIKPDFAQLNLDALSSEDRIILAKHFVQRRRADVENWIQDTPFPQRESTEESYRLSKDYRDLFDDVYDFARGLVKTVDDNFSAAQKRGRYWSALAIIRCVMSSPAAAVATLSRQASKDSLPDEVLEELNEDLAANYVYDFTDTEQIVDVAPSVVVEQGKITYSEADKRKLKNFVKRAAALQEKGDQKLQQAIALVKNLLKQGYQPILWCRYISTANYYAQALREELEKKQGSNVRVIAITGEQSEDEREIRLKELTEYEKRILIATDCLSEGINLQQHFNACIHIDLPFNPNRLAQREGRIDRYGQPANLVKCILYYGQDNPVDGAILEVLLRKAVKIHNTLGITVPIPMNSASVQEAVFQSLFEKSDATVRQLSIFDYLEDEPVAKIHQDWDYAVEKEKINRTRFAQRAIKAEEVEQELKEADEILGGEADVERFVKNALSRLGTQLVKRKPAWELSTIPQCLQPILGNKPRKINFTHPTPEGVEYIGRNHPLVEGLARFLFEEALNAEKPIAARCGVTVTQNISKPTFILLLRLRHLLTGKTQANTNLAEECLVRGFTGTPSNAQWLSQTETLNLLSTVKPTGDLPPERQQEWIDKILYNLDNLEEGLKAIGQERANMLLASHGRLRKITKEGQVQVIPQLPMDILGIYILLRS
ncbi:MAG: DEAD/DEAH box helicase [Gomphosphaeria aponina SAG 52.96 = DSM 107014]|uniref:DEAD/DEAH box helicase n=1 Tax=Gomphosphaeria aponina SAG 52.96 = DSM 107014 TaxID=1521640 RepID=A0A941GTY4_9CHRO|nr:DEAD/DEAH box helicase [Gomphosphaeria aponina SAG 52.96 = DSM 107014]